MEEAVNDVRAVKLAGMECVTGHGLGCFPGS